MGRLRLSWLFSVTIMYIWGVEGMYRMLYHLLVGVEGRGIMYILEVSFTCGG